MGFLEFVLGPLPWWLGLAVAIHGVCSYLFAGLYAHDLSRKRWTGYLIQNTWAKRYRALLGNMLDWIDTRLTPEIAEQGWKPDEARAAWSYGLLNLSLLLAFIYPILSVVVYWAVTGADGRIQTLVVLEGEQPAWRRLSLIGGILLAVGLAIFARSAEDRGRRIPGAIAFGLAAGAASGSAFAFGGEAGVAVAFAVSAGIVTAGRDVTTGLAASAGATTAGVLGAIAAAAAITGGTVTEAGATTGVSLLAAIIAGGALVLVQHRLGKKFGSPVLTLMTFVAVIFVALSLSIQLGQPTGSETDTILVFLGILPIVNALADFASIGLTRWRLRKGLAGRMWREMLIDVSGGAVVFFVLGAVSILAVDWIRWSDGTTLFDLAGLFTDIHENPHDYWWLYFTLLSTLIPTLLHAAVALFGTMIHLWPGLRRFIVEGLEAGGRDDVVAGRLAVQALCLSITVSVIAPVFVLGHLAVYHGIVGHALLDLFEGFAQLVGAIPSR